ncbi:RTC4-like domain-containing protein [Apodospora peruviana]|uniref:Restriction of telomere capping protein 4 n=1 Tax=Apodospora peruviana TaxID=516989 RepID=A0AAE0MEI1_9PEZI|nr:RTC4-like domain-containing protein [Apodospora peruviana]
MTRSFQERFTPRRTAQSQDTLATKPAQRFVGLSNKQTVAPLLKSLPRNTGQTYTQTTETPTQRKDPPKQPEKSPMGWDVADDAPPQTSSDEEDGRSNKADIQRTNFTSRLSRSPDSRNGGAPGRPLPDTKTRATRKAGLSATSPPNSQRSDNLSIIEDSDDGKAEKLRKGVKRKSPDNNGMGSRYDAFGFAKKQQASKKFSHKSSQHEHDKQRVSGVKTHKDALAHADTSPKKGGLKLPGLESMKQEEISPRKSGLKKLGEFRKQDETPSPRKGLRTRPMDGNESPTDASPQRKRARKPLGEKQLKVDDSPEERKRPVFIIPELYPASFDMAENDHGPEITETSLPDLSRRSTSPLSDIDSPEDTRSLCPMCNEEVDPLVLTEFKKKYPRMTLRQEQMFCTFHKKTSAKKLWMDRGYPDIKWEKLDKRIAKQYDFLRDILKGGKSHYGDIFSQKVKAGQNKTLLRSEANLTPGYYGIRGLRAMSENLIRDREFSSLLRDRAVKDRLVSARGHTAYVQAVLVPELAVRLIKQDMDVGDEEARAIMKESVSIGELLNEEEVDVVHESESDSSSLSDVEEHYASDDSS